MDYLLRDSYHAGMEYGRYDWRRIVGNVALVRDPESGSPRVGISDAGRHAAEGMIIARYMMFNQVYYHHTRVILDRHLQRALGAMLPGGKFPPPTPGQLDNYLAWDDWKVLGALAAGGGGDHGRRLRERDFFRWVWETPEIRTEEDDQLLQTIISRLKMHNLLAEKIDAAKSWYKVGPSELPVLMKDCKVRPLSLCSTIVGHMKPSAVTRLYVRIEDRDKAKSYCR
jgi:uncharacterized protein